MAKHDNERLQMYISLTNITIVICWVSLLSFWTIKLMGGNWFEVVVTNQNFIAFSNFVQNTWAKYVVSFITILMVNHFRFCVVNQGFFVRKSHTVLFLLSSASMWAVSNFVTIDAIQVLYGYIVIVLYGVFVQKSYKRLWGLLCVALEFLFSTISILVRNVPLEVSSDYVLSLMLSIDVYIMYALYYLYTNLIRIKKEK